jgi:HNH endonuclease
MPVSSLPTIGAIQDIVCNKVAAGTGAKIITRIDKSVPPVLHIGFEDLGWRHGPRLHVAPYGMRAYRVTLHFGNFSRAAIDRMNAADAESHELAISILEAIEPDVDTIELPPIEGRRFEVSSALTLKIISSRMKVSGSEERIGDLTDKIVVPVMSALAELNGYDEVKQMECAAVMEGALNQALVQKRERNPRNRLLALKLHGTRCKVCNHDPGQSFGFDRPLVEIHHLQPLSMSGEGAAYNPKTELVPLCPTCHRAAHTRRPVPYSPEELQQMREAARVGQHDAL